MRTRGPAPDELSVLPGRILIEVSMETIKLSPRLSAIASLIPLGSSVADIGTDHGYLPVYLAQCGTYGALAACDINAGPLENAQKSASAYGVHDKIRFEQCSGLAFPGCEAYDTVVIAGMGGELIASILQAAAWTKCGKTLILQPNSKIDALNRFLETEGYCVTNARLVKDTGKLYQILVATGGEAQQAVTIGSRFVHPMFFQTRDPFLSEYLDGLIRKYSAALEGMRRSQHEAENTKTLETLLRELMFMRKETETWQP